MWLCGPAPFALQRLSASHFWPWAKGKSQERGQSWTRYWRSSHRDETRQRQAACRTRQGAARDVVETSVQGRLVRPDWKPADMVTLTRPPAASLKILRRSAAGILSHCRRERVKESPLGFVLLLPRCATSHNIPPSNMSMCTRFALEHA